jgi:hypothetical protein
MDYSSWVIDAVLAAVARMMRTAGGQGVQIDLIVLL